MSKTVFAFGRMNPPTVGHEKLASKVESEAKRRGAMPHIYLSHTQNAKKDPLPYNTKIAIAKKAFGKAVTKSSAKNVIQIMQDLEKMGHTEVVMVAGSDRVPEFKSLLGKYTVKNTTSKRLRLYLPANVTLMLKVLRECLHLNSGPSHSLVTMRHSLKVCHLS